MFGLKLLLNIVSHVDWKLKIRKCEILDASKDRKPNSAYNRKVKVKKKKEKNGRILSFRSDLGTKGKFFKQLFHRLRVNDSLNYKHQLKK